MPWPGCWLTLAAVTVQLVAARRSGRSFQGGAAIGTNDAVGAGAGTNLDTDETGTEAMISALVGEMLEGKGPKLREIIALATKHITLDEAIKHLDKELPADVDLVVKASTQQMTAQGMASLRASRQLNETSMQRARVILNNMVYTSQVSLDDLIFECKEFQERNRGTYEQVMNDLGRLGSQLAALGAKRLRSGECINSYNAQYRSTQEELEKTMQSFRAKRMTDSQEITRRRNDLAVFEFILNVTECPAESVLLQQSHRATASALSVCVVQDGIQFHFNNPKLQAEFERRMTPSARAALRAVLGQVNGLGLLQHDKRDVNTTSAVPTASPVVQGPGQANSRKCVDMSPDPERCGKIHDAMSVQWGKFRDQVDELAAEMSLDQQQVDTASSNLNQQMTMANDAKTECMQGLASAVSSINSETEEMNAKEEQKRQLATEYDKMCAMFKSKITSVLHEDICAILKVRNSMLAQSTTTPPNTTIDCEVGDWTLKTGQCLSPSGVPITCDDTCPRADPNLCGGMEDMVREVVVAPTAAGLHCPALVRQKRCGQRKCKVDCSMSTWSGWSRCSRECEGGIQMRTRSVLVAPRHGGMGCPTVQEERSCNTGSCDRDCRLADWTEWAPCSVACGGGLAGSSRSVLVPIRGQGKCPEPGGLQRSSSRSCNTQACAGDEICIAQQDLVIALDGSGSVRRSGFEVLRNFAVNLTMRYRSKFFGLNAVKMGATVFGNGRLEPGPDGSLVISSALETQALTFDLPLVRSQLAAATWQRGFTNLAQALSKAAHILARGGREDAQSAVIVLSDGKPSFKFQTARKARELKDKNIRIYMAPVAAFESPELDVLKTWATSPWQTHYVRIPGLAVVGENPEVFVQQLLVKFCPDATSPQFLQQSEARNLYMIVRESGMPDPTCGEPTFEGTISNRDDCAARARVRGFLAFTYGKDTAAGKCLTAPVVITPMYWNMFAANRTDPPCPGGAWRFNPYYDTFFISPTSSR